MVIFVGAESGPVGGGQIGEGCHEASALIGPQAAETPCAVPDIVDGYEFGAMLRDEPGESVARGVLGGDALVLPHGLSTPEGSVGSGCRTGAPAARIALDDCI